MPVCCVVVVVVAVVGGGNLVGVLSFRAQDRFGVGGWGDATRNSVGLALSIFQDGSTGLPTRLGGLLSVTEPSNSVFPHPSTVHRRVIPKTGQPYGKASKHTVMIDQGHIPLPFRGKYTD